MAVYSRVDGAGRAVKNLQARVGGASRKIREGYVRVNGAGRLFYRAEQSYPNLSFADIFSASVGGETINKNATTGSMDLSAYTTFSGTLTARGSQGGDNANAYGNSYTATFFAVFGDGSTIQLATGSITLYGGEDSWIINSNFSVNISSKASRSSVAIRVNTSFRPNAGETKTGGFKSLGATNLKGILN